MDLEQRVQELKDTIELMKRYYMKGFGNVVCGILINSSSYMADKDDAHRELVLEELDMIEGHYRTINFEELESNEDFAPLFVTRDLLKLYGGRVRTFLCNPDEDGLTSVRSLQIAVGYVGEMYRDNLNRRLRELRAIPGYSDFRIELIDYKGAHFVM